MVKCVIFSFMLFKFLFYFLDFHIMYFSCQVNFISSVLKVHLITQVCCELSLENSWIQQLLCFTMANFKFFIKLGNLLYFQQFSLQIYESFQHLEF
jgi:hypothetical protein